MAKQINQDVSKILNNFLAATGDKKSWIDSDLFKEWVREQNKKFECENRKILLIADNCPAHLQFGGLKAIETCFLSPNTTSITQPMDQGVVRSLKAEYRSRMIQQIIKAIISNKSFPKDNVLDAMEMLTVCWEDVTEETVKSVSINLTFPPRPNKRTRRPVH